MRKKVTAYQQKEKCESSTFKLSASWETIIPLPLILPERSVVTKKQSINIRYYDLLEEIAKNYRWSMNDLINYTLELFLFFIDTPRKDSQLPTNQLILIEADSFQNIKNYSLRNELKEGELLRAAIEIFVQLIEDGHIAHGLKLEEVQNGSRTLPGVFSDRLKEVFGLESHNRNAVNSFRDLLKGVHSPNSFEGSFFGKGPYEDSPCSFIKEEDIVCKKQSITFKYSDLLEKISEQYRWSMNDFVNYTAELFLCFIDSSEKDATIYYESHCLQKLRNYAIRENTTEGEMFRSALETFDRLIKEGVLGHLMEKFMKDKNSKSIPQMLSEGLSKSFEEA